MFLVEVHHDSLSDTSQQQAHKLTWLADGSMNAVGCGGDPELKCGYMQCIYIDTAGGEVVSSIVWPAYACQRMHDLRPITFIIS